MPNVSFDVTPGELNTSAKKIENDAGEFKKAYESIYTAVEELRVNYKGEASETFNQKINSYRNDFTAADTALANYVQFLRTYAENMLNIENNLKSSASSLSAGR